MTTTIMTRTVAITVLICMPVFAIWGTTDNGYAASSTGGFPSVAAVESHGVNNRIELPRSFQGVRLGMGRVEVLRMTHPGSMDKATQEDSVVSPGRDRYVKRVEYGFYKGTLYRVKTQYRPERIPGGVEALILRLKETYGAPIIDGVGTIAPAPGILSEKRTVWNDGRTEIAFIEQERDIEIDPEIALVMVDVQLAQMKQEAADERRWQQIRDVPIPMPDRSTSNRTAGIAGNHADGHAHATKIVTQSS